SQHRPTNSQGPLRKGGPNHLNREKTPMKLQAANDNRPNVLLRYDDLKSVKGIPFSRSHLARLEDAGMFPKRVRIGANTIVWLESEVDAYIASKTEARAA